MLQILPYLLLKKIHFATLYLNYKVSRNYNPLQVNMGCISHCIRSWLGKCIQCTVQLILKVQCMGDADAGSSISCIFTVIHINQIDCTPEPLTRALVIVAFAPRRILITSCIRSTLSVVLAALFTIVIFSTVKSD